MNTPDRGLYTPPADAPLSFDARDAVPVKKGPMLLVITALLVVAFVVVVWSTFKSGVRERGGPPHIAAAEGSFKSVPDDIGGAAVPDTDKTVYDTVSGEDTAPVQSFAAGAEEPVDRASIATVDPMPAQKPMRDEPSLRGAGDEGAPLPPAPDELASAKPAPKPAAVAVKPAAAEPVAKATGSVMIQIAAGRDMAQANAFWTKATSKFPELKAYTKDIQEADLGDKGMFYRVRAKGFASKADASAFCAKMKAGGLDCMVK